MSCDGPDEGGRGVINKISSNSRDISFLLPKLIHNINR